MQTKNELSGKKLSSLKVVGMKMTSNFVDNYVGMTLLFHIRTYCSKYKKRLRTFFIDNNDNKSKDN